MKITLITVGKIKERFFEAAIEEYSKRLSRYCKLEIIQVADEKTPDGASEALERQIREKEGERILSHIRDGAYVIALAIRERSFPVRSWLQRLPGWQWREKDSWCLSSAVLWGFQRL